MYYKTASKVIKLSDNLHCVVYTECNFVAVHAVAAATVGWLDTLFYYYTLGSSKMTIPMNSAQMKLSTDEEILTIMQLITINIILTLQKNRW